MSAERVDWPGLMRLGLGVLRLPPEAFWAMTPRELDAAAAPLRAAGGGPMSRDAFAALRARYPDRGEEKGLG